MKRILIILVLVIALIFVYLKAQKASPRNQPAQRPAADQKFESKLPEFKEIAGNWNLQIVDLKESQPGIVQMTVIGANHSVLVEFLEEVQNTIALQDFDSTPAKILTTQNGRRLMQSTYTFRYRVK